MAPEALDEAMRSMAMVLDARVFRDAAVEREHTQASLASLSQVPITHRLCPPIVRTDLCDRAHMCALMLPRGLLEVS